MAKRSMALDYLLLAVLGMSSNLAGDSVSFCIFTPFPLLTARRSP